MTPALETEALKQREARHVVRKDETDERAEAERRAATNGLAEQAPRDTGAPILLVYVEAGFRGGVGRRGTIELLETQPAGDRVRVVHYPQRPRRGRVGMKPRHPAID